MSATTSNRGYVYPQSGDDFRPYEDIQALAEDVDVDVEAIDNRLANLEIRPHTLLSLSGTIANNTIQVVTGAVLWDPASQWSSGAPTRITATASGLWEVGIILRFASQTTAAGERNARIYKNGAEEIQFGNPPVANYNGRNIVCAGVTQTVASVGDYFEAYAYQSSGGSLALTGNNRLWAKFLQL